MSENRLTLEREGSVPRIALVNRKGGSGKTTTGITIAAIMAGAGLKVRYVDGDPQYASATSWIPPVEQGPTLKEVFFDEATLDEATSKTSVENLYIVPSNDTLNQVERDRPPWCDSLLSDSFTKSSGFDVEIIDCSGQMGSVTVAGMVAATHLVIPLKMSGLDFLAQAELIRAINPVRERMNSELKTLAVLLVDADRNTRLSSQMVPQLQQEWPGAVVMSVPHSVRAAEAPLAKEPLTTFAPENPVTRAYVDFVRAIAPILEFEEK